MMTVDDLITKLLELPRDARVVVNGFDENELDDCETVELIRVVFRDDHPRGHCGQHLRAEDLDETAAAQAQTAVFINF